VKSDREKNLYRKVIFKEDKIVGCILLGDIKGNSEILNAIEKQVNVKDLKNLILEEGFDFKKLK
jgi:nitrite reductase (NADH) large subunit